MALSNQTILKAIGLPQDTLSKLQTLQGTEYEAVKNEFLTALVNKICYQQVEGLVFSNPFKKFDSFPVNYGDTIENVFVRRPKGKKFDKDDENPFKKYKPDVKAWYVSINYELQYPVTIQDSLMRRAVLTQYGFMNLIDTILQQLTQAMILDEYYATIGMLDNPEIYAKGIETITRGANDTETAKKVTKQIVDLISSYELPSADNNKAGELMATANKDILLVIKPEILNMINLDYLTGVFNLSKVEFVPAENIIKIADFKVPTVDEENPAPQNDIDFVLLDVKGFDNHVALQDSGIIYNPAGKYTNHFTNLWKIVSYKYYHNARAFKLTTGK